MTLLAYLLGISLALVSMFVGPTPLLIYVGSGGVEQRVLIGYSSEFVDAFNNDWEVILTLALVIIFTSPFLIDPVCKLPKYYSAYNLSLIGFPPPRCFDFTPKDFWLRGDYVRLTIASVLYPLGFIDLLLALLRIPVSVSQCKLFPMDQTTIGDVQEFLRSHPLSSARVFLEEWLVAQENTEPEVKFAPLVSCPSKSNATSDGNDLTKVVMLFSS